MHHPLLHKIFSNSLSIYRLFYSGRIRLFGEERTVHPTSSNLIRTISIIKPKEYEKVVERSTEISQHMSTSLSDVLQILPKVKEVPHPHNEHKLKRNGPYIVDTPDRAWKIEEFGGVKMWVNKVTGEVSINNPNEKLDFQEDQSETPGIEPVRKVKLREVARRYSILLGSFASLKSNKKRTSVFLSEDKEVQEAFDLLDPKSALKMSVLESY